ncbi:sensor histidine kinase [Cellulomonas sp. Y8]|uniref:sensor histidine kinase n=1 Tax=Cellulomonas sp. Y8 TaxID=2591145 RepID=UPI003D74697C
MSRLSSRDCPAPLMVSFWVGWVLTLVVGYVEPRASAPTVFFVLVVVLVTWLVLPWCPVSGWRRVTPVGFFLAVLSLAVIGAGATYLPLLLVALANLTFSLGRVAATAVAVAQLALMFAVLLYAPGSTAVASELIADLVSMSVLSLFGIAMADAVIRARARRAEAMALLAQVEELTIAGERARMARDMHDSLGHALTAVKLSLDAATLLDERGDEERAREEVTHARRMVVDALVDTRRWVRALKPMALEDGIGAQAFGDLADSFRGAGIRIEHEVSGSPDRVPPRAQLIAYRVVQESLANAVRYSRASTVRIAVDVRESSLSVVVADDGTGVADADVVVSGGFGLGSLAERVEGVGGTFTVSSSRTGGFEVAAQLPL